ncbi:MAG: glycosyltransferase family 9 protein [Bacteroidota bacterium]
MNKILIIQTAFLGDVVLATSIIEKLVSSYPKCELHFLLRSGNQHILDLHPKLSKIWVWDKKHKYAQLFTIIRKLRNERFDLIVNLQRFASSGLFTILSGAKETRGFKKNPFSFFFSKSVKHEISSSDHQHEINRNHKLIADITDLNVERPKLYPSKNHFERVKGYTLEKYITIAPASVWYTKQWPKKKWVELINNIDTDYRIYLIGAPGDSALCDEITAETDKIHVTNLAGKLSPLESVALIKGATMNFVNDSAPLHFASAVNASVTAIFCSTVPNFGFGPLSDDATVVEVKQPLACRPCGLHGHKACPEKHFKCALDISTDQMIQFL